MQGLFGMYSFMKNSRCYAKTEIHQPTRARFGICDTIELKS